MCTGVVTAVSTMSGTGRGAGHIIEKRKLVMDLITIEQLEALVPGDLVLCMDPFARKDMPYAFVGKTDERFYFVNQFGASLSCRKDDMNNTITCFKLRPMDNTHPAWDDNLSNYGKNIEEAMGIINSWFSEKG